MTVSTSKSGLPSADMGSPKSSLPFQNPSPSPPASSLAPFSQPPIPLKPTSSAHSISIKLSSHPDDPPNPDSQPPLSPSSSNSDDDQYEIPLSSPIRILSPTDQASPQIAFQSHSPPHPIDLPGTADRDPKLASSPDPAAVSEQTLEWDEEEGTSDEEESERSGDGWRRADDEDGSDLLEREPLVTYEHDDGRPASVESAGDDYRHRLKRRRKRRVYGGGRLDWGGELQVWEVALGVSSDILSPAPLFVPHALLLLGLPIGVPVLFLTGFLAWFSHVVLVVCGRYVGGRTFAQVASAALPDGLGGFNLWFGETAVELWRVFVAGGRGMVNMMMVSDLFAQLTKQYTPKAAILYSRVFIIALVALLSLVPNFVRPRRPIFLPASFPTLSRLPLFLTFIWPLAIGIIGFRLRQLNRELGRKLPPTGEGDVYSEIMGGTVWGGFTILLFCLTTPQNTFSHLRSLKRIHKPPGHTTHPMVALSQPAAVAVADPLLAGSDRSRLCSSYTLRRYSWEAAALLGVLYASLICLGWGLVGYLGMEHGGYEVNFLGSLPANDVWISSARVLLLVVLVPAIPLSLRPATTALFHLMRIPLVLHTASSRREKLRSRGLGVAGRMEPEWDDEDEDSALAGRKAWGARAATVVVWAGVALGAIVLGGSNGGEGSSIEILGCVGSTIMAGLLPAVIFVVLFHIRKARSIFINDCSQGESSHLVNDDSLMRKEVQVQKRLSGRRIWQDVGVFGMLIPFCVVVLGKGVQAVFSETGPDLK